MSGVCNLDQYKINFPNVRIISGLVSVVMMVISAQAQPPGAKDFLSLISIHRPVSGGGGGLRLDWSFDIHCDTGTPWNPIEKCSLGTGHFQRIMSALRDPDESRIPERISL